MKYLVSTNNVKIYQTNHQEDKFDHILDGKGLEQNNALCYIYKAEIKEVKIKHLKYLNL